MSPSPPTRRDRVFVSYAHKDADWLALLKSFLKPDIRNDRIDYFDDQDLKPGDRWHKTILDAIDRARVAVLLVSPNFFASDFIRTEELPRILAAAEAREITILWLPLFGNHPDAAQLSPLQAVCDPSRPFVSLTDEERTGHLLRLCREISRTLNPRRVPENLPFASLGDLFVGGKEQLNELQRGLEQRRTTAITQAHTLSGLGGVGKTRLAAEYAWKLRCCPRPSTSDATSPMRDDGPYFLAEYCVAHSLYKSAICALAASPGCTTTR